MLISRVHPVVSLYRINGGQYAYSGSVMNFTQNIHEYIDTLPMNVKELTTILFNRDTAHGVAQFRVRSDKVLCTLLWLKRHNIYYKDISISNDNLDKLPSDGQIVSMLKNMNIVESIETLDSDASSELDDHYIINLQSTDQEQYINKELELPYPTCETKPLNEFEGKEYIAFEWQNRGSPHVHGLLYLQDESEFIVNDLSKDHIHKIQEYFDTLCLAINPKSANPTCSNYPSQQRFCGISASEYENDLGELINAFQRHTKCGTHCYRRANFQLEHKALKFLIADEMSMIGAKTLGEIESRCHELFPSRDDSFAGLYVFMFGEYKQLSPVKDVELYNNSVSDAMATKGAIVFQSFQLFIEVSISHRQGNDRVFSKLLDNLANGDISVDEYNMLSQHKMSLLDETEKRRFDGAIHLIPSNDLVRQKK
uniref:DUF6570 domain-containing protein n=1 Tax=Trichogramma kaykai TaxID=54128 RepID=A0ABD2VSF2_9HYME